MRCFAFVISKFQSGSSLIKLLTEDGTCLNIVEFRTNKIIETAQKFCDPKYEFEWVPDPDSNADLRIAIDNYCAKFGVTPWGHVREERAPW